MRGGSLATEAVEFLPPLSFASCFTIHLLRIAHKLCSQGKDIASLDEWLQMQAALIEQFKTDPAIKDASRIMRLARTISYPSTAKAKKGYETEVTVLEELE